MGVCVPHSAHAEMQKTMPSTAKSWREFRPWEYTFKTHHTSDGWCAGAMVSGGGGGGGGTLHTPFTHAKPNMLAKTQGKTLH